MSFFNLIVFSLFGDLSILIFVEWYRVQKLSHWESVSMATVSLLLYRHLSFISFIQWACKHNQTGVEECGQKYFVRTDGSLTGLCVWVPLNFSLESNFYLEIEFMRDVLETKHNKSKHQTASNIKVLLHNWVKDTGQNKNMYMFFILLIKLKPVTDKMI